MGTQWLHFELTGLNYKSPVVYQDAGVKVTISPPTQALGQAESQGEIPILIENSNIPDSQKHIDLKREIYLLTEDGQRMNLGMNGAINAQRTSLSLHAGSKTFDPDTTSLVIRIPATIEIVPLELTFNDVPIIER